MPEPEKKKASECPDGTLIVIRNAPTKLIKGGRLPLVDRDGNLINLFVVRDEVNDFTLYIHPDAVVDVIWEPKPVLEKPGG